jgi:hypothetical protein
MSRRHAGGHLSRPSPTSALSIAALKRTDLHFLNACEAPAVLLEICFVDSETDAAIYKEKFNQICENLAYILSDTDEEIRTAPSRRGLVSLHWPLFLFWRPSRHRR